MAGPIQIIPQGLLGLLQLKQTGQNPSDLLGTVAPNMELFPWYMQRGLQNELGLFGISLAPVTASLATGAISRQTFTVTGGAVAAVPNNATWYVENMLVVASTAAAADSVQFVCMKQNSNGSSYVALGPPNGDIVTARNRILLARNDRAFWMSPGDQFAMDVIDIVTVGIVFTLFLRGTSMPI